jgi:hypothetical protein
MGHACSSVIYTLKLCLVLGVCPASVRGLAPNALAAVLASSRAAQLRFLRCAARIHKATIVFDLGSGRDTR